MFPAKVYAAVEGLTIGGAPAAALVLRTLMQLVCLAATLTVLACHVRGRRRDRATVRSAAMPNVGARVDPGGPEHKGRRQRRRTESALDRTVRIGPVELGDVDLLGALLAV